MFVSEKFINKGSDLLQIGAKESIDKSKNIIPWGNDNLYPENVINTIKKSVTGQGIFETYSDALYGDGLFPTGAETRFSQYFLNTVLPKSEFRNMIDDFALFGWIPIHVRPNTLGDKIAALDHFDITTARIGGAKEWGDKPTVVKINPYWRKVKNHRTTEYKVYNVLRPEFELGEDNTYKSQIYILKNYAPNEFYYPSLLYSSALLWMYIEGQIAEFHSSNVDEGFFPSVMMLFDDPMNTVDEKDPYKRKFKEILMDEIRTKNAGVDKAGKIIGVFPSRQGAEKPTIMPFNPNNNGELFINLEKLTMNAISRGFRMPLSLANIEEAGKLGASQDFLDKWNYYMNAVIIKIQNNVCDKINELAKKCQDYDGTTFTIKNTTKWTAALK